ADREHSRRTRHGRRRWRGHQNARIRHGEPDPRRVRLSKTGAGMTGDDLTIRVPIKFVRKGGRKLIFTPDGKAPAKMTAEPDDTIIAALLRAHVWNRALKDGKARSATALAKKEGINESYM